ncbi:hypothetical protein DKM44_13030 [Deinococcus irradiatisoli]|uniref:DUF3800 domain-containing protein n=1 Tax=Deinococcus irradiatisoli TaxID=2202254 RepID=A0A2Z3JGC7_9DEIO|nr:DUF3800 domain-containing protein [Deinococcus irradiatisoli]AWN24045.1 hypothetical protein DKM44_13030 [Deinococcus irradiatisoli]
MTRYHVFIDESEDQANLYTVLGAILVPEHLLPQLEREMNKLRASLGRTMRRKKYPIYFAEESRLKKSARSEARRIRAGGLPEIHAKDIWDSSNVFQCERSVEALERRNEWLYKISELFIKFDIIFMSNKFEGKYRSFVTPRYEATFEAFLPFLTKDQSKEKIKSLLEDVHYSITFELFLRLDTLSELDMKIASVTCDKGRRSELFGRFLGFDRARKYGYWQNFPTPIFVDSFSSNGIQIADFATYFMMKTAYLEDPGHYASKIYERVQLRHQDFKTSLATATQFSSGRPLPKHRALLSAMITESILLHCGGLKNTEPLREAKVEELTRYFLAEYRPPLPKMAETPVASYKGPVPDKSSIFGSNSQFMNIIGGNGLYGSTEL